MQLLTTTLILISLTTIGCAQQQAACPYNRQAKLPIVLALSPEVTALHIKGIKIAIEELERQTDMDLFELVEAPRVSMFASLFNRTVISLHDIYNHPKTQYAVTSTWAQDCIIRTAYIEVNTQYYKWETGGFYMTGSVNAETIYVHELMHALGVPHSTDPESVMFATGSDYERRIKLTIEDVESIQLRYKGVGK